jgi:hypothetical protein
LLVGGRREECDGLRIAFVRLKPEVADVEACIRRVFLVDEITPIAGSDSIGFTDAARRAGMSLANSATRSPGSMPREEPEFS